jgi:hypothetical protein
MLPMHERELPENTPSRGIWLSRLQRERQEELGEFAGPYVGRYNVIGRRAWWANRDVDAVLREHGYVPPPARRPTSARSAPTQARSRSSSSDGCSAARSAPYPPPARHNADVVIRDAAGSSSAPPPRAKKEEPKEEEEWEQIPPELLEETRPWWVEDREILAKDALGLSLAVTHSLVGAGGATGGARGGLPVFGISDSDEDVKPDVKRAVKKEDDGPDSSTGRRNGDR